MYKLFFSNKEVAFRLINKILLFLCVIMKLFIQRKESRNMKVFVDVGVLLIVYFWKLYKKWASKGKGVLFINTIMYIYVGFVLYFTLMPIITSLPFLLNHPYTPMNLQPFIDVTLGRGDFVRQVGLNVLMMIPFGFLLPFINKEKMKLPKVLLFTFLFSLSIELFQPLLNGFRSSDITDIITNTIGGCIGYTLYLLFYPFVIKIVRFMKNTI